jgi:hypothetical protein
VGIHFDGLDLAFVQGFHRYDSLKEPTFFQAGYAIIAIDRVEIARFDIGPQVELLLMFIQDNLLVDDMDLDKKVEIVSLNLSVDEVGVVGMSQRATGMLRALPRSTPVGKGEGRFERARLAPELGEAPLGKPHCILEISFNVSWSTSKAGSRSQGTDFSPHPSPRHQFPLA